MKDEQLADDQVWNVQRIAQHLGFKELKTRRILARSGIAPVRTQDGVGYMSSDIKALSKYLSGQI